MSYKNNILTLLLSTGLVSSMHVLANEPSTALTLADKTEITDNLVERRTAQISDKDFVFDPLRQSFDIDDYFENQAPHLAQYKTAFSHWVGFHSINPTLVLALMEKQSKALSHTTASSLSQPFAELSSKQSFNEQLNDVLGKLNRSFYQIREQQQKELKQFGQLKMPVTAATQALTALLSTPQQQAANRQSDKFAVTALLEAHDRRFNKPEQQLIAKQDDLAQRQIESQQATATPPVMQLPWSLGYTWKGGGSHGYDGSSGPHSSIDYAYDWPAWGGQTWSVRSAHSGYVTVLSSCQVRVSHPSGWATNYYHLSNVPVYNGQWVGNNTHIGYYASNKSQALCQGGQSTGPHLHFSLLKDGYYYSLDNIELSRYKVNTGRWHYDNNCYYFWYDNNANGGSNVCAWWNMYNQNPF